MSDSELVRELRQHDPLAFQRVRERYLPSLWRYVLTRVDHDPHVAEDIVSETMLALIQAFAAMDSDTTIANLGGWLRAVANNKVQDYFRATARVRHLLDDARQRVAEADCSSDPARQQEAKERRLEIRRAMDQLPDQYRIGLEWKYLDKLSVREIAERWGTTEKAAESILFRARREFRERLKKKVVTATEKPRTGGQSVSRENLEDQAVNTHIACDVSEP